MSSKTGFSVPSKSSDTFKTIILSYSTCTRSTNLLHCFFTSKARPPDNLAVTVSVSLTPGVIITSCSGNKCEGIDETKVSTRRQKSKADRHKHVSASYSDDKPSKL